MNNYLRYISVINAFIIGAIGAVVFVAIATVGGELYSPFKDWLKESFWHHWVGKGILSVYLFLAIGAVLSFFRLDGQDLMRWLLLALLWFTILGFVAIAGFYAYEAFFAHHP